MYIEWSFLVYYSLSDVYWVITFGVLKAKEIWITYTTGALSIYSMELNVQI